MLSLNTTDKRYNPAAFPITDVLIAPFWADADTTDGSGTGHVYYRSTINQTLLDRATAIITTSFADANFVTEHLYIVTWFEVGYYGQTDNSKVNLLGMRNTWIPIIYIYKQTFYPGTQ